MIQLHPKETFTIVRQIEDHTDSTTYYVRAFVRNAKTDVLLDTINLDNKGDRRFTKTYIVPADPSGEGVWISILTSVYTDSGYTTKSQSYADKMESYLVQARPVFNPNYPIPTGQDIDYSKIRKIIVDEISKNKPEPVDLSKVADKLSAINSSLSSLLSKKTESNPVDLTPVLTEVRRVLKTVGEIEIPEIDYSLVEDMVKSIFDDGVENLFTRLRSLPQFSSEEKSQILKMFKDSFGQVVTEYQKYNKAESKFKELIELVDMGDYEKNKKEEEDMEKNSKQERINRLMKKV